MDKKCVKCERGGNRYFLDAICEDVYHYAVCPRNMTAQRDYTDQGFFIYCIPVYFQYNFSSSQLLKNSNGKFLYLRKFPERMLVAIWVHGVWSMSSFRPWYYLKY